MNGPPEAVRTVDKLKWCRVISTRRNLSDGAFRFAFVLVEHFDFGKEAIWASQATLAEMVGRSERMVNQYMAELVNAGLMTSKRGGPGKANRYILALPDTQDPAVLDKKDPAYQDHADTQDPAPKTRRILRDKTRRILRESSLTEPLDHPLEDGPAVRAGLVRHQGMSLSEDISVEDSDLEDAPDAALRAAGASVASINEEDDCPSNLECRPLSVLDEFRLEGDGRLPTMAEFQAFADGRGIVLADRDLDELRESIAELADEEEEILETLRSDRRRDRWGESIYVPPSDGRASTMLANDRLRALYVGLACTAGESMLASRRLTWWSQRLANVRSALTKEGAVASMSQVDLLDFEFLTELRRRESETHAALREISQ